MATRRVLFTLIVTALSFFAQTSFAQTTDHKITGTVVDVVSKTPIANASILLGLGNDAPEQRARTDASGRFSVAKLPPGKYMIMVVAKGYAPQLFGARGPQQVGSSLLVGDVNDPDIVIELYPASERSAHR